MKLFRDFYRSFSCLDRNFRVSFFLEFSHLMVSDSIGSFHFVGLIFLAFV